MPPENSIASLREEHRSIVRVLDTLQKSLDQKKGRPRRRELTEALGTLLRVHLAHEEETIYWLLNSLLKGHSPTGELKEDHRTIELAFARLWGVVANTGGKSASMSDLRDRLELLQYAFREHMEKQEKVVFWLALSLLYRSKRS